MNAWSQIVESLSQQPIPYKPKSKELVPEKKCTSCGVVKKRSEFYNRADHSPNALMSRCKECFVTLQKKKRHAAKAKYTIGDNSYDEDAKFEFPD